MFSQDQPTPINSQDQAQENSFDDSILFSQHSNYGNNLEPQTTFTVKDQINADQLEQNDFSRFLTHHNDVEQPQQQQMVEISKNSLEDQAKSEKLKSMIQYANYVYHSSSFQLRNYYFIDVKTLQNYGFSALGDLLNPTEEEIQTTINTVLEMITQRQRDVEFRKETVERMAKLESDRRMYMDIVDRKKSECAQLSKEIGSLKNEILMKEKKFKSEKEKISNEKEDLAKQLNKFSQKITQYQHEIRKKDVEVNKIKEQVRSSVLEKMGKSTNSEISSSDYRGSFHSKQLSMARSFEKAEFSKSYENDFTSMIATTPDNSRSKLISENQELRKCLQTFFRELTTLAATKKEEFITKKISEGNAEDCLNIRMFYEKQFDGAQFGVLRWGAFELPIDKAVSELQAILKEHLKSFEAFFDKIVQLNIANRFIGDVAKEFAEIDERFSSIKNIMELRKAIKNLKSKNAQTYHHDINKENCIETKAPLNKLRSGSPFKKDSTQGDETNHSSEFAIISQDGDSSFEEPPVFIHKKSDAQSPQVKRTRPEISKWKLGLHFKANSVSVGVQDDVNSGTQDDQ